MPELVDEVAVAFEDGDPERPVILGSLWDGVQQAPRFGYYGEDIAPNNIKRIITKSGNRIQIVDNEGQETIMVATPGKTEISLTEKTDRRISH
jgi:type VI secretion system secreted protein VgrG